MFTESSIDRVREADIVQVIGRFVPLKKAGSIYEAKSPFSSDKTPSFKVNPTKNNWVCYSTQKKGDGIKFVMEHERCDFITAAKKIAEICGIYLEEEKVSEETQRRRDNKAEMLRVVDNVANQYKTTLQNLPADHWAIKALHARGICPETVANFGIGFAPENSIVAPAVINVGKLEPAKNAGLVRTGNGRDYDFFRDRIMFPIEDVNGNVVAFGGRRSDTADGPKYINSPETELYIKSKTLYGLPQAKKRISQMGTAVLTEGYTDVTGLHQYGCDIAVSTGGTNLDPEQAKLLKRFARRVIICRDNDGVKADGSPGAGTKATLRDINILLLQNIQPFVCILPEGEDPDSFSRKFAPAEGEPQNVLDYVTNTAKCAVTWKATWLKNQAANDPFALSDALSEASQMLFAVKDDVVRKSYMESVRKVFKISAGELKEHIADLQRQAEEKATKGTGVSKNQAEDLGLPEGASVDEFFKKGFCTAPVHDDHGKPMGNAYWFKETGGFVTGTNYVITPLFHVAGNVENKRLCEVVNIFGQKRLIDLESKDLVNQTQFESRMLDLGNFIFTASLTANNFKKLKGSLTNDFITANEIADLGWQQNGFHAYADCVYHGGNIKRVNNYGIVTLETEAEALSEYHANSKYYYLPAYSEMHRYDSSAGDQYENDRYCVYRQSPVTLNTWMAQIMKVYGFEKTVMGIAFNFATLFRDVFMRMYQYFPHMFLTGEKGSGKSKFGESLQAMFTYKQPAFDLNSGTIVAFYRRMARYANAPSMFEEMHDNIEIKMFQSMKGAADGRGREMGKASGDNKTISTKVNCSLIILGQYLSSRDDNSLTTRSVLGHFIKRQDPYTTEDIENYTTLKAWEEQGINSLITEIIQHRGFVVENLHAKYAELSKKMKKDLQGKAYEQRVMDSYLTLMTPVTLLWNHFTFPFTQEEMWKLFKDAIVDSSDLIVESEGLSKFWQVLEHLYRNTTPKKLLDGVHFKIDIPMHLPLQAKKGEAQQTWNNDPRRRVLILRLNLVHQLYQIEAKNRGDDVITESTMKNYFRSKKYFIGPVKSYRFKDTSTSAYAFDYDMLENTGLVNLITLAEDLTNTEPETVTVENGGAGDDLPF
nr:DNA primase [uncultured Flavobacterium sp.]